MQRRYHTAARMKKPPMNNRLSPTTNAKMTGSTASRTEIPTKTQASSRLLMPHRPTSTHQGLGSGRRNDESLSGGSEAASLTPSSSGSSAKLLRAEPSG